MTNGRTLWIAIVAGLTAAIVLAGAPMVARAGRGAALAKRGLTMRDRRDAAHVAWFDRYLKGGGRQGTNSRAANPFAATRDLEPRPGGTGEVFRGGKFAGAGFDP